MKKINLRQKRDDFVEQAVIFLWILWCCIKVILATTVILVAFLLLRIPFVDKLISWINRRIYSDKGIYGQPKM